MKVDAPKRLKYPNKITATNRGMRILIADDSASSRDLLRSILEGDGHDVVEAEDGEQLLAKANTCSPDLVILDLQMPRLDGYGAAMALRKIPKFERTPILALSAAVTQTAPEQIAASGFSGYLVKPIKPTRLRQCIAKFL